MEFPFLNFYKDFLAQKILQDFLLLDYSGEVLLQLMDLWELLRLNRENVQRMLHWIMNET